MITITMPSLHQDVKGGRANNPKWQDRVRNIK